MKRLEECIGFTTMVFYLFVYPCTRIRTEHIFRLSRLQEISDKKYCLFYVQREKLPRRDQNEFIIARS